MLLINSRIFEAGSGARGDGGIMIWTVSASRIAKARALESCRSAMAISQPSARNGEALVSSRRMALTGNLAYRKANIVA